MKFIKLATPLLTWREPRLFAARMRDRRGWMLRGALALFIAAVMMAGFYADRNWGGRGPKFSTPGAILMSAFIGLLLTSVLDAPDLNRQITIYDDKITSFGNAGPHSTMSSWALRDILWVRLVPPEELGRSFGAMELQTHRAGARIGVPASVSMSRIAEVLHARGISFVLPGCQPVEAGPTAEAGDRMVATRSAPAARPTASARVERLAEGEAGQIATPFRFRLGLTMALGPLILALCAGLGLCGYAVYRLMILRVPVDVAGAVAGLGGVGLIVLGFWFTGRFGNLVPMRYLRGAAHSVIEMRPSAVLDPKDPEVVFVDVIPRTNWGKLMLKESSDTGLLKVDELSRCLLFEGDHERWRIPAASLISAEVDSYRPAGHVEGQEGGEVFFVTVIRANIGGEVWEAPVSKCHVEFRPKNNRLREANALGLRDRIRAIMPLAN